MQLKKAEREKNNAQSSRFSKRIGSTVYEVNVRFDTAKAESLEDKILRLVKRDMDSGQTDFNYGKKAAMALNLAAKGVTIALPQADWLPERGSV
jgi:hypothetical protein